MLSAVISFLLVSFSGNPAVAEEKLSLGELADHFVNNYELLNSDMLQTLKALKRVVEDGVVVVDYFLQYHREGFEEFAGEDGAGCTQICQEFKAGLLSLLANMQQALNQVPPVFGAYAQIQGLEPPPSLPPIDASPLIEMLGDADIPAFLLYPIYDAMKQVTGDANVTLDYLNFLYETLDEHAMQAIIDVGENASQASSPSAQTLSAEALPKVRLEEDKNVNSWSCQQITNEATLVVLQGVVPLFKVGAVALFEISDFIIRESLKTLPMTDVKAGAEAVGGLSAKWDINVPRDFADFGRVMAEIYEGMANALFNMTNKCRLRLNNQVMFCMLSQKNLHGNRQFDTHKDCLEEVAKGERRFGF